jgi:phospholipid N-methyltransferase
MTAMPTLDWLQKEFAYGYDSGNVLGWLPNLTRLQEERRIGGSYKQVFKQAVLPYLTPRSRVLELGPGKGSWTRAILRYIPSGNLHVVDFQDVRPWLQPERYDGRLVCHQVQDNHFSSVPDDTFDFFWSMGVLCHNNLHHIAEILTYALPKMKSGAYAVHQYADWNKLNEYGWKRGHIPTNFQNLPDDEIWWPRNNQTQMQQVAEQAGWQVLTADLDLVGRDSLILLRKPK